jgi:nucleoside 2-deoxyribosyltransferase
MNIYLCGRYGRREELAAYARDLGPLGHTVTSRWVFKHDREDAGDNVWAPNRMLALAEENLCDLRKSDLIIVFTENSDSTYGRGGRHIETGYALAMNIPVVVVGERENIFHALPLVQRVSTWEKALTFLYSISPFCIS